MNTRVSYRYTDKTNCKQYTSIVVEGVITWEQIEPFLYRQSFFIPGQIGLEDLQKRFALAGMDHPWHQILPVDLRATDATPTSAISAEELAQRFATTVWSPTLPAPAAKTAVSVPARAPSEASTAPIQTLNLDRVAAAQWSTRSKAKKPAPRKRSEE